MKPVRSLTFWLTWIVGISGLTACNAPRDIDGKSLIVLAIDGMDPKLLRQYMAEGRTPNLANMAEQGGFTDLGTSIPPQSPVAWSTFITGQGSEVHGIYDFVHRNPDEMMPYLSTSKAEGPAYTLEIGEYVMPLGGEVKLLRHGQPFWSALHDHGIQSTVIKIPANYPPEEPSGAEVLSGMGTPDVLGTPGSFFVFTLDPDLLRKTDVSGGRIDRLKLVRPTEAHAELVGPPDPLSKTQAPMVLPIELYIGDDGASALLRIGDAERIIRTREWTDWIPIAFEVGGLVPFPAMVRAYAKDLGVKPTIYLTPLNIDPIDPVQPISSPPEFAADIAKTVGRFYTQGMPEDTKALSQGALTDDEFLSQEALVFQERIAMLDMALDRYRGGFLFFYFSNIDLVSHMFWRAIEPDASPEDRQYKDVIPDLYHEMDKVVGKVMDHAGDTPVVVMSDHGFAPFRYKVHLNRWLLQRGYLVERPPEARDPTDVLGHIDWSKTRAYALGLNQLFLNLKGREPAGIVEPDEAQWLLRELSQELTEYRDNETGRRVVSRVFRPDMDAFAKRAPDLIIGYARGYRSSDESALGQIGPRVVERNTDKWSGDHCMDPAHVPGVLLSNKKLEPGKYNLTDLAPTISAYLEGKPPTRSFFAQEAAR